LTYVGLYRLSLIGTAAWKKRLYGLANYKELFTSDMIDFKNALGNALLLALLSVGV
jgi:ABC-type sugar transport system permease subunit